MGSSVLKRSVYLRHTRLQDPRSSLGVELRMAMLVVSDFVRLGSLALTRFLFQHLCYALQLQSRHEMVK